MFQTMTQIAKSYDLDAKDVGNILYDLKIRDAKHPEQKGFPFDQAITHGIAQAATARSGETYYRYDISSIQEEFEKKASSLHSKQAHVSKPKEHIKTESEKATLEHKLHTMLALINEIIASGEIERLYKLKADIADIYALTRRERLVH